MTGPLLLPIRRLGNISSFDDHIDRTPPSSEPGVDLFTPIGTDVFSPAAGTVWGFGTGIQDATGRWVGIDFDNGMSCRVLHLLRPVRLGGRVDDGELIGVSGATGYGTDNWEARDGLGAHVHWTVWPTHEHRYGYTGRYDSRGRPIPFTIDPMLQLRPGGGGGTPRRKKLDMRVIKHPDGTYALIGTRYFQVAAGAEQANLWAELWGDHTPVSHAAWQEAYDRALDKPVSRP